MSHLPSFCGSYLKGIAPNPTSKWDYVLGWVPGTMHTIRHASHESLAFVMDGGQYAPSPTGPNSRFRRLKEQEG